MEASAIPANVGLARTRTIGAPLLRLRSDDQLVSMFRCGDEDAFRTIHDRYRPRLVAYTRQMLAGSSADAEDAVQEIFVRAYAGLRASHRELALRAWLYRVAHNRCIDELRRPQTIPTEEISPVAAGNGPDPVTQTEQRDALRRLIADVQRLPDQQRSALLMRELGGMTYADVSGALGVTVPAVKSLLVRARIGLAQASEARDTACTRIRADLIDAHDRGVRTSGLARRHMRDCPECRQFRSEVRGVSRQLAAFGPALGPLGVLAKLLGLGSAGGGGAAAGGTAVAGSGAAAATGAAASVGALTGAGHVVTLIAAAVVTAGGALELQHVTPHIGPHHAHRAAAVVHHPASAGSTGAVSGGATRSPSVTAPGGSGTAPASSTTTAGASASSPAAASSSTSTGATTSTRHRARVHSAPSLVEKVDPDMYYVNQLLGSGPGSGSTTTTSSSGGPPAATTTGGTSSATTPSTASATSSAGGSTTSSPGTATGAGSTTPATSPSTPSPASTPPAPVTPAVPATGSGTGKPAAVIAGGTAGSASVSSGTTAGSSRHRSGRTHRTHVGAAFVMTGN